jgi:K+-sensing histidine kinase KdpD
MKFTIAYTLLFIYVILAILFWGYSLNKQSKLIYQLEKERLDVQQKQGNLIEYEEELHKIEDKKIRRTKQYLGEGSTFILIILFAAGIVYVAYYRQRKLARLQQNFMLSVTHELKTPIASIKLNLQTIEKRKLEEDIQKKLVQTTVVETNRLNDLCNNILVATQLENARQALYNEEISINALLNEEIETMQSRYPEINIQYSLCKQLCIVNGDTSLWKLVFSNLLENARKYSMPKATIEVILQPKQKGFFVQIKDQGVGIADTEKKRIFDKFYRIGNENTRATKGTGLGLYIVKKIVTLYKYDITVKNNTPKGSIFEVDFS